MSRLLRIAIADDEPEVREYFAEALSNSGHKVVVSAANGRELIKLCQEERPDLLITDIRMDEFTGIEAMQQLSKSRPLPTILLSAHCRAEDFGDTLGDQVIAFLRKPVKLTELEDSVTAAANSIP